MTFKSFKEMGEALAQIERDQARKEHEATVAAAAALRKVAPAQRAMKARKGQRGPAFVRPVA